MEALEDVKVQVHTYDAEMGRTGGGVFNSTLKSGTNQFRGTAFFQTRPLWGQENNYFSQRAGRAEARQRVLPRRRRRRRADRQEQDVLLVRHRELPRHSVAQRIHGVSDGCRTNGRLLEAYQRERATGRHLRPSDQAAVSRKRHPGEPYQRRSLRRSPATSRCRTWTSTTAPTTTRARPRSTTSSSRNTRSRSSTSSPTRCR